MFSDIQSFNAVVGNAPILFETISPSLKRNKAGIPLTPKFPGDKGFSIEDPNNKEIEKITKELYKKYDVDLYK